MLTPITGAGPDVVPPGPSEPGLPMPAFERLLSVIDPATARILDRALSHPRGPSSARSADLSAEDGEHLLGVTGLELHALVLAADEMRRRAVGDVITFVVTRNINFTNVCHTGCSFCAFSRRAGEEGAYRHSVAEVVRRAEQAWALGATEVCMQGGLHPEMGLQDYLDLVRSIRARLPDIHIHAFSPFEIQYMARRSSRACEDVLRELKDAGLGSIPGTAAEILDTDTRRALTKNKLTTEAWVEVVRTAHRVGLFSSATIMYGHIDGPRQQARHIALIRDLQAETGGFTEFVPLGFIHQNTRLYASGAARPGPTGLEDIRIHAVARLMLDGWIPNIQVSWVKLGPRFAQVCLMGGANDFGGTLMEESISRSAGADHGEHMAAGEFVRLIRDLGRVPARRSTGYAILETYGAPAGDGA